MKKKRGRPKGSRNKPKTTLDAPRKRGRPKGSKNKPKQVESEKKRGRPRLKPVQTKVFPEYEGVNFVARVKGPSSDSHRWIAVLDNQRIGFYKTPEEASVAYQQAKKR